MKLKCSPKTLSAPDSAFSLVELLTVMGVMSLVIAMTVPLVKGPGDSQKLRSAAELVTGMSTLARQNSLGQNAMTALVCAGKNAPGDRGLRSLALFELRPNENGAPPSVQDWKQVTPWKQFPAGVLMDDNATESTFFSSPSVQPVPTLPTSLSMGGASFSDYSFQVFQPNGRILGGKAAMLKLLPAVLQNGVVQTTGASSKQDTKNYIVVTFIGSTGQTKVFQP